LIQSGSIFSLNNASFLLIITSSQKKNEKKKADSYSSHESANGGEYMNIQDGIFPKEINCGKLAWPSATLYSCITISTLLFATLPLQTSIDSWCNCAL